MAQRDYKNSEPKRGGRSRSNKKGGSVLKAVLVVVLVSLALAGVILWKVWPRSGDFRSASSAPEFAATPATKSEKPAKAEQPATKPAAADNAANYTFYDILPGDQTPKPLSADKNPVQWWLQVAALKNASDADALRAKLTLLNFSAIVQPTPAGETPLYRVRVGPYQDQAAAATAQKTLAENKYDARPVKEAVSP